MRYFFNSAAKGLGAFLCACLCTALGWSATFTVTTTADSGAGSLRQAILDADGSLETNTIIFQILIPPFSIAPATVLPSISTPTLIDGTTQIGFLGTPVVELNGTSAGATAPGLQLSALGGVRGLVINRFSAEGIILNGPSNVIQGNYIGTDVTGANARANASFGIWLKSPANLIGGTNAGNGNVISGGNDTGIYISGTGGNIVQGNLIGLTATGNKALGNVNNGITVDSGSGNWIGGANAAARNVISGNGESGIYLNAGNSTSNSILGNYIGLDISGASTISNAADGITLNSASGNTIGAATAGAGNVISGNGFSGISINGGLASNNIVIGNFIGTDSAGKVALGNQIAGVTVSLSAGNQIGGTNNGAGNVISGNKQDGIFLTGNAARNLVLGNLIGLSAAGTNAVQNGFNGISLSGAVSNTIGGSATSARNVISGNADNGVGILILGDKANSVLGNYIGLDVTGKKAVPNILAGVRIQASLNTVSGNVVSGNGQQGVWLVGTGGNVTGNVVQGNFIGLDMTGVTSLANGNAGVGVTSAAGNQIGGTTSGAGNVISANGDAGIFFLGAGTTVNQVLGNFIGTDLSGTLARGNTFEGIYMQDVATNFIGGSVAGAGNVISGNNTRGLWLTNASWNVVQGNFIGTQADGTNGLGNTFHGIDLDVKANTNFIGGSASGAGNRFAFAKTIFAGVRVRNGSTNNLISGNSIFSNGALGIDLGNNGVNPIYDCESGVPAGTANAGQNFPVLTDAYSGNGTRIRGTLDSGSGKTYLLQFFASPVADSSGYGEGQVFLGQTNFTLGAMCSSNFTAFLPASVPATWVITATATSPVNNTSEFSAAVPIIFAPPLQIMFANTNQISLSWTNNGGSFVLQQTYNLSPPAQWTTVGGTTLTNGFFVGTIPATNSSTFYRLMAQ
jgi:parallel beta-helix repeat protein